MKVVTINSNRDIFVYGTSYTQNKINEDGPQTLNLNTTTWLKTKILIKQGIFEYPAEVKDWATIKALEKAHALTVSQPHDGDVSDQKDLEAIDAKAKARRLEEEENAQFKKLKARKAKLNELADKAAEKQLEELSKIN